MFGNERFSIVARPLQRRQCPLITDVAQRHTNIAQQTAAFGAQDRCVSELTFEIDFIEAQQLKQVGYIQVFSDMTAHQSSLPSEPVPGTDSKAIVAAVNAVANRWTQLFRTGTFQLDSQIGDAATGIELKRRGNRISGARLDATGTSAAMVLFREIRFEFEGSDNFTKK